MLRGPPHSPARASPERLTPARVEPQAPAWNAWRVIARRIGLVLAALLVGVVLAACGDSADEAVDQASSQANDALDQAGLRDDLDRTQARVEDLVADAEGRTGVDLAASRRLAEKAIRDARARVEREIDEARASGDSPEEIGELRRQARERLDDLGDRVDEALGP